MIGKINNFIQLRLKLENLEEVPLTTAAKWVEQANLIKNSKTSPGYSLRRHIHRGNIFGAFQKNNYFWFIKKIDDYSEIFSVDDLTKILGLKSRTSLYRKINNHKIPHVRNRYNGIYFRAFDLLKWVISENRLDLFEKIQEHYTMHLIKDNLDQVKIAIQKQKIINKKKGEKSCVNYFF